MINVSGGNLALPNLNGVDISKQNLTRGDYEYTSNFPIFPQGQTFGDTVKVSGYPSYILACPNKKAYASYTPNLKSHALSKCGVSLTLIPNNVNIYVPELSTCSGLNRVNIYGHLRNTGSNNITSASVKLMVNSTVLSTQNLTYSGTNNTASTMGLTEFKFDNVLINQPLGQYGKGPYKIVVDKINGVSLTTPIEKIIKIKTPTASTTSTALQVELKTDNSASQLSWVIYNSAGTVVNQNTTLANNVTTNTPITLANNECYTVRLRDVGGDGGGPYGDDAFMKVKTTSNTVICDPSMGSFSNEDFGYDAFYSFKIGSLPLSINEADNSTNLSIYPNPTSDKFRVETPEKITVDITDLMGKTIRSIKDVDSAKWIDISDLQSGLYFAKIKNDKSSQLIKIIKE